MDLSQRLEIERIRNEFVSTVSHELRTPLTSIRGSLGLLQSGAMGALPEKAAEMVSIAYKNSGRLVRIINDILDISMIEAGKLTLQMRIVTLAELLQQSVEANAGFAEKCEVRFLLEPVSVRPQGDGRPRSAHAGAGESVVERGQVLSPGLQRIGSRPAWFGEDAYRGAGLRRRHPGGIQGPHFFKIRAGRCFRHETLRGNRLGAQYCAQTHRSDGGKHRI